MVGALLGWARPTTEYRVRLTCGMKIPIFLLDQLFWVWEMLEGLILLSFALIFH